MIVSITELLATAVAVPMLIFSPAPVVEDTTDYICEESIQEIQEEKESYEEPFQLYSVNGETLREDLQKYLYESLKENQIDWWFTYALCQMYQESRFNIYAVNKQNNEDMGLFQYKIKFWYSISKKYGREGADIFDPYAQIDVYSRQIRESLERNGWDNARTISDHFTGGYGYSEQYVSDVLKWARTITLE